MKSPPAVLAVPLALAFGMAPPLTTPPASAQSSAQSAPVASFPHDGFGAPARVVASRHDPELGATIVTFTTGARLIVKPTRFSPGQVSVVASFGAGRSGVPENLVHAVWATTLFPVGGTQHMSYPDLDAWQQGSGHPVNVTLVPAASAFRLQGEVPSGELEAELALLTAYAREPGFRSDMTAKIASVGQMMGMQIEGDVAALFTRTVQRTLFGPRYQELPEQKDIEATTGAEIPALLERSLAMAPDVTIVGDIEVDAAIHAVAAPFAAGEARPVERRSIPSIAMPMLGMRPMDSVNASTGSLVRLGLYWPLPNPRTGRRDDRPARVAAAMIEARLAQSIVPASTAASPPVARAVAPADIKGGGYLGLVFSGAGMAVPQIREFSTGVVKHLASGKFTAAELAHALQMVTAEHRAEGESNDWWAQRLGVVLRDGGTAQALGADAGDQRVDTRAVAAVFRRLDRGIAPIMVVSNSAGPAADEGRLK